jgi:coenzyme Q-binding protein COQ10
VADVDSYHRFLPFCTGSRVLTPVPDGGFDIKKAYEVEAELSVGFMGMNESYMSLVLFRPHEQVQVRHSSSLNIERKINR